MKKHFLWVIFFVVSIVLTACSMSQAKTKDAAQKASDFTLEDINGAKINLYQTLKSKKAVLVFWATWCPYCVQEIPEVEKFYNENKQNIAVIAIDLEESKAKVASFVKKMNISYPVVLDADGKVGNAYSVRGIPTVVAVDKDANIVYYGNFIKEAEAKFKD